MVPRSLIIRIGVLGLLLAPASVPAASAQEMPVPVEVQYPLFLKMLTFNRDLEAQAGDELVIGVAYQPGVRPSWLAKDAFMQAVAASRIRRIKDLPVRVIPLEVEHVGQLRGLLEAHQVDVLYVTPLRAVEIEQVAEAARAQRVITLAGVPAYARAGLAVSIDMDGRKPRMLINRTAARAAGADFHAQLLRLAHLID